MKMLHVGQWGAGLLAASLLGACAGGAVNQEARVAQPAAAGVAPVAASGAQCAPGQWFCEDFQGNGLKNWNFLPAGKGSVGTADGKAELATEGSNRFLRYSAGQSKGVVAEISDAAWSGVAARKTADYYVEARIRPVNNQTSNKFVCLLGRYQDASNWLGACLNVQNSASSKVEFHKANDGKWLRARQFATRSILNDQWYKLRLEMEGSTLKFYIDDDLAGTFADSSIKNPGKIGLWLDNRSFDIDDIVVGSSADKPSLLALDPDSQWQAEADGSEQVIQVGATRPDSKPDTFSVVSSNPKVVSVRAEADRVTLRAVGAGTAKVTFTSGSNPALSRSIDAKIEPAFVMAESTYGKLSALTRPAAGSHGAYADELLALNFDAPVQLTGEGSVRIYRARDNQLVDVIRPAGESDAIGPSADGFYRGVKLDLIRPSGKQLLIRPHSRRLEYGTQYYVALSPNLLKDARLAGKAFTGLGKRAGWSFTTRAAPPKGLSVLSVDDTGTSAHFRSVQGALNYAMKNVGKSSPVTVKVANGFYEEMLFLRGKSNVTVRGENREHTVIRFANYESLNTGSGRSQPAADVKGGGGRALMLVEDSDLLTLERMTMQNTHLKVVGVNGQAEVIYFNGDSERLVAKQMNFLSRQDTIQTNGYAWFYDSLIAGDVDFIWGSAHAALFENSEIRTIVDSTDATKGGYLVQARVTKPGDKGYVFLNSRLTREANVPEGATVLARSAGSPGFSDNVVYINCVMDKHIDPAGWLVRPVPNPAKATAQTGWREFGSRSIDGKPLDLSARDKAAQTLSAEQAAPYLSRERVFEAIGWQPKP